MGILLNLFKKADSYGGGSSSGDFLGVMDGSETSQRDINNYQASNGDNQGSVPAGGKARHPVTTLGEQGHEKPAEEDTTPYNETLVDDNHANNEGGISASRNLLNLFIKTADENTEVNPYENFALLGHEPNAMGVSGKRRPFNIPNLVNHGLAKITKAPNQGQPGYKPGNVSLVTHYNMAHASPEDWTNTSPHITNLHPKIYKNILNSKTMDNYKYHQILWGMHDKQIPEHEVFTDVESPYNKPEDKPGAPAAKTAGLFDVLHKADETNFFLHGSTAGGVADSPQTMNDGHPREELVEQEGMDSVINNTPHPTNEADRALMRDKSLIDKSQSAKDKEKATPDIYKGKTYAHLTSHPFMTTSIAASQFRGKDNPDTSYKNESNVANVMYSQEEATKHDRAHSDFGTGDQMSDGITMGVAPLSGDGQSEEEKNYSGRENSTAGLLRFFTKHADYSGQMPSSNPNSGQDSDASDTYGNSMSDGKNNFNNVADKEIDPARYRQQMRRNKVEDDDAIHYYQNINSGGGFGMEGHDNFSGVNGAD